MRVAALVTVMLIAGCAAPSAPPSRSSASGAFRAEVLGASPRDGAMRWEIRLENAGNDALPSVRVAIDVTLVVGHRPVGHDETHVDVPPGEPTGLLLKTTDAGLGDYEYDLVVQDKDGRDLDRVHDVIQNCLCSIDRLHR